MIPSEQNDVHLDLGELTSLLLQYSSRLGRDDASLRIKVKYCQLVESILGNASNVALSNDGTLRNAILDTLVDWAVEAQRV